MKYVTIDGPLKPKEITDKYDRISAVLNRGQSSLISFMADPKMWAFIDSPAARIEVIDLSETFDLGLKAEFKNGKLTGWKGISVF